MHTGDNNYKFKKKKYYHVLPYKYNQWTFRNTWTDNLNTLCNEKQ